MSGYRRSETTFRAAQRLAPAEKKEQINFLHRPPHLRFLTPVNEKESRLEDAPQLRPALEGSSDLEPVGQNDDGLVLEGRQELPFDPLLHFGVALPLGLVGLLAVDASWPGSLEARKIGINLAAPAQFQSSRDVTNWLNEKEKKERERGPINHNSVQLR